ncbi:metabotropic glutamate receptor 2-like [Cydia amplana]|uniref:metabotropic glutamate receptor 2-like n=1 Tax=Cydia amplana TaxID=1869771 RepID=UPI002FE5EFC1
MEGAVEEAALAAVARPAALPCALARLAAPALGGVYAAVLARTVRIARLVAGAERGQSVPLLSSRAQVAGWTVLVAPGVVAAAWAAARWPPTPRLLHPGRARAVLACGGERATAQLLPLAPALLLLACCAVAAIRTRRLPHNFNETRFIGAATYTTGVAWLAMSALFVALEARAVALCACASLCAGACVALSLGPRAWLCLCRPQRNTRAHFLTNTSIRCHIGKYRPAPVSQSHLVPFKQEFRDKSVQTAGCAEAEVGAGAGAGSWCAAAGVCARVTRSAPPAGGREGEVDVVITLLHHRHVLPVEH